MSDTAASPGRNATKTNETAVAAIASGTDQASRRAVTRRTAVDLKAAAGERGEPVSVRRRSLRPEPRCHAGRMSTSGGTDPLPGVASIPVRLSARYHDSDAPNTGSAHA